MCCDKFVTEVKHMALPMPSCEEFNDLVPFALIVDNELSEWAANIEPVRVVLPNGMAVH